MKAILQGTNGKIRIDDVPEPQMGSATDVKLSVVRVGICGTDREQIEAARPHPPSGSSDLIPGHEMVARVIETGDDVVGLSPGDFAVVTVRRGCNRCTPCIMGRPDMCRTGDFRERGIAGLNGFQCEVVVDTASNIVHVPSDLGANGVLTEPLSVVEKAIQELERVQYARVADAPATTDWLRHQQCLVAGLGPVGLLAALVLRLRGARVFGLDIVDADSPRPRWLCDIGGDYIDGRTVKASEIDAKIGEMSVIVEATGAPRLAFNLIDALGTNGAYVLTGLPAGHDSTSLPAADLMRQLVRKNQLLLGSVNASRDHYSLAVDHLTQAARRWPGLLERLITHHYEPAQFEHAARSHPPDEIKAVIEWNA